jgi:hypothetical protein
MCGWVWEVGVQDQKHTENGQEKKHMTGILYKEFAVAKENIHSREPLYLTYQYHKSWPLSSLDKLKQIK